jgi:hypothetical protein
MTRTGLIRLCGLATMIGSAIFALVVLLNPWLAQVAHDAFGLVGFMEVVLLPMFLLLFVVVLVAIAAIAALLQRTRYRKLAGLASIGSLVGMAFIVVGLLTIQEFVGLVPMFIGVLVLTVTVGVLGVLSVVTNVLGWWGSVALVAGPLLLFFAFFGPLLPPMHWLIGVPWMVLGFAIFRAGVHQAGQPSRVR